MESDLRRPKYLPSFAERVIALSNRSSFRHPPEENVVLGENHNSYKAPLPFQNKLPLEDVDIRRSFIRHQHHDTGAESILGKDAPDSENLAQTTLLPAIFICVPIALLASILLGLVYLYKIELIPSLFTQPDNGLQAPGYILVNFSATRLVFLASFLSTIAPLLTSSIMAIVALPASRMLLDASRQAEYVNLPTPFQMSLLIGILVASAQQLRSYLWYLLRRRRSSIPPVLHRAAWTMILSLLFFGGVFIADSVLHYTTSTVEVDQIFIPPEPVQQIGRGLSDFCLKFNRTNIGYPCSVGVDSTQVDPNASSENQETIRLFHNTSQISEIQTTAIDGIPDSRLAYLVPTQQTVLQNTDYNASTIGITTKCRFIRPSDCAMELWQNYYTNFSCTDMFHGTLGMPPNVSNNINNPRPPDPYRSFLMYKPAGNMMYSFFNESGMRDIYNTVGYDDSANLNMSILPYPDSQLVNPFYMGFAGRFYTGGGQFPSGHEMLQNKTNATFVTPNLLDFVLNCAITSYDIDYTWVNGSLQDMHTVQTTNGSVLEIFHGAQVYATVSAGDSDLQSMLVQSTLAGNTTESFVQEFGRLYSTSVLSVIGGYSTGRTSLAEQQRVQMLLSRVPIAPLAVLVAWCFLYTVLGLILGFQAYWASRGNVRNIAMKLSLLGLSQAAFGDHSANMTNGSTSSQEEMTWLSTQESRRIHVHGSAQQGFEFGVML